MYILNLISNFQAKCVCVQKRQRLIAFSATHQHLNAPMHFVYKICSEPRSTFITFQWEILWVECWCHLYHSNTVLIAANEKEEETDAALTPHELMTFAQQLRVNVFQQENLKYTMYRNEGPSFNKWIQNITNSMLSA